MKLKNNLLFVKILSCFLLVIFVITIALGVFFFANSRRAEEAALETVEAEFRHGAEDISRMISQIRYAMAELSVKFAADSEFENGTYIENNALRADMRAVLVDRRQNEFSKYLSTAFLVDKLRDEYIYELTGTYTSEVFYNQFFVNETYTDAFWTSKTTEGEGFEIFPALTYITARDVKRVDMKLLPISYKPKDDSRYLIVAFLDIEAIARDFGISGISLGNGKIIYSSEELSQISDAGERLSEGKTENGNVFKFTDGENADIEIYDIVLNSELRSEKRGIGGVALILLFFFILLAAVISFFFAFKISETFACIANEMMSNSSVKARYGNGISKREDFLNAMKLVSSQEKKLSVDAGSKDSVLDSMLLQAHMRDVYVGINDIEARVDYTNAFFVIYFKVSYLKELTNYMHDEGKATFLLKQLIEMYLETWGIPVVTFQTEKNGIVSVFDAGNGTLDPKEILENILIKLSNESEYAYFTVSLSEIHDAEDNVKAVYEKLIELSKYGKPVTETQVLCEGEVKKDASRFYFSVEEMGKFSASLQNGTEEEVIHKVDEILEYNLRKDINRFEMYLLCTEIVNCAVKLVNRVFYTMPQSIDISSVYRSLERAEAPGEYRKTCIEFLHEIIEYIKQNKREDDYIISYILDYVENHYSEDIYLNLFAEKLKLTGAYISSYFKEKMNVNLTDYINNYRIKKAVALSENPQNKNKDIAEMVGLPNINTFIRLFKKYTGYTPGEYRKKHFGEDGKK